MYKTKKQKFEKSAVQQSFLQSCRQNALNKLEEENSETVKVHGTNGNIISLYLLVFCQL